MPYRIWIVNYYTSPNTTHPRYLQFARHFMAEGWEVTTLYANHNADKGGSLFAKYKIDGLDFIEIKAPYYSGNGLARMMSIWAFAWRIFRHSKDFERPDVILHNIHLPFDYPIVWAAKKIGCKYIAEAWDLWPEDFVTTGLISRRNPLMRIAYQIEKHCYYYADDIVFTILGGKARLVEKGWTKDVGGKIDISRVHYINNGVDLEQFDRDVLLYPRKDEDINRKDIFKIVYLGSLNVANNVQTLVEAAEILKNKSKYVFFIYGDGTQRDELKDLVQSKHLTNVVFKEKCVPFSEVAWIVSQATVNIMNYEKDFGRWGVSSGKMFLYLAAGKPIVCNIDIKYDNVIKDNDLGICKDIVDANDFAVSISKLAEQPKEDYDNMCHRVRRAAERFDFKFLAKQEISVIQSLFDN